MRKIVECLSTPSVGYANSRSLKLLESLSTRQKSHRDNLKQSFSIERKIPLKLKDEERRNSCFVQKEILSPPGKGKKEKDRKIRFL